MATAIETLNEKYGFLVPTRPSTPDTKMSTPGQHKFYRDLCEQKRRTPIEDVETLSFNQLSGMIEELKDYRPVSDAQLKAINSSIEKLANVGITVDIDIDSLTGGREGTASQMLEKLFELVNKHCPIEASPASDKQIEYVASMYLCPAVDFESYGIDRWVYLEDGMKRRPTSEEFFASINTTFNRSTISEFINKNRAEFNEWRSTRVRPGQLKHILSLLSKHGGSEVDELTLLQFSQEEADLYIKTLIDELKIKVPTSIIHDTRDLAINITSVQQAKDIDEENLRDTIFSLMAETGCEFDGIDCIKGDELREWFAYLLDKEFISVERLTEIISENESLSDMLEIK